MSRPLAPTEFAKASHSVVIRFLLLPLLVLTPCSSRARSSNKNPEQIQQTAEPQSLELGKPLTGEIAGEESRSYLLTLPAGQTATIQVDQQFINVEILVFDQEGKKIADNDMIRMGDPESVSLIAEAQTTYRIEVRGSEKAAPKARYEIKIKELRPATQEDKSGLAAERLVAEGIHFDVQATAETWRKAIDKYQQAVPLWRAAKSPAWGAATLYLISTAYMYLGEKQKGLDSANQALPLAEDAIKAATDKERRRDALRVKANALDQIGRIYNTFGDKLKALEYFNQALPLRDEAADQIGKAGTLNNMATSYQFIGEFQKALELLEQMGPILAELKDRGKEATRLNNMCVINEGLGDYRKALDLCNRALSIRRDLKDKWGEATVLNNMGNSYSNLGDFQSALDSYNEYYRVSLERGDTESEGIALNNIGWVYATLGDQQKAIDFYNKAMEIFRTRNDQYREGRVLNNIAVNYADMKDFKKALEVNERVLALRGPDNEGRAITLNNLASCYQNLGDKTKALDYYNQSLAAHRAVGNPKLLATALRNFGTLYRDMGDYQKAMDCFNEGLQLSRTIGDRHSEAGILSHIAKVERDRGNLLEARDRIEEALKVVESLRVNIKSYQLRSSFFASIRNFHEFDIDLLMRLHQQHPADGYDVEALQVSERGRARSLLELLSEANAQIKNGVHTKLLERERTLRQLISERANRQTRLLNSNHTPEQVEALANELDNLTNEYEQVQTQIRQTSPRFAALTQPQPLNLKEIQNEVLDRDTLLLEYALGNDRSFVWAVTPDSIHSYELPKRAEIESTAKHVFDLLTVRNQLVPGETLEQRRTRFEQAEVDYAKTAADLSKMLLGPLAAELKTKRIVVVGEGVLQYVPFAALPIPSQPNQATNSASTPLIVAHEVINLPSASVLAVLRRETTTRKPSDKTVAVFADPVFDPSDPRLLALSKRQHASNNQITNDVKRSAAESGLQEFVRLRFTRQEADQITGLVPENSRLEALDFAANRTMATSPEVGNYRILHFATHGLINNQHPELSGVVLSLVNERGLPDNGFLRLYDIYNLKLRSDLVVLSACQTAVGKEIKGEGLMGLTRGFMYAGAPRVVASLWQIEDRASAEFMSRFYEPMLRKGLRPAAALRAAQISMWQDKRWGSPYYWAAFTLQGEWK